MELNEPDRNMMCMPTVGNRRPCRQNNANNHNDDNNYNHNHNHRQPKLVVRPSADGGHLYSYVRRGAESGPAGAGKEIRCTSGQHGPPRGPRNVLPPSAGRQVVGTVIVGVAAFKAYSWRPAVCVAGRLVGSRKGASWRPSNDDGRDDARSLVLTIIIGRPRIGPKIGCTCLARAR